MEKIVGSKCPRCGQPKMNVYTSDGSDNKLGAWCEFCDFRGFFFGDRLESIIPPKDTWLELETER